MEDAMAKRRQDSFRELNDVPGSDVMSRQISRFAALRSLGEVVYAVRCGDLVKIGHTGDLDARIRKLKADELLAFAPGTVEDEQAIHAQLTEHVERGREWYRPAPSVMTVVNEMRERLGLAPVA